MNLLGRSVKIRCIESRVLQLRDSEAARHTNVLILGESGTGKNLIAEMLHLRGHLSRVPCCELHEETIEAELFGYVRGAFSGAHEPRPGLLREGDGGTVFLDEIGDIPRNTQKKLLTFADERKVKPVGGSKWHSVNCRIVSATNSLELENSDRFRLDLYHRLAGEVIRIPPLRERREDIMPVVEHYAVRHRMNLSAELISAITDDRLQWPGNVRELLKALDRARYAPEVVIAELRRRAETASERKPADITHDFTLVTAERQAIIRALRRTFGNKYRASLLLETTRPTLDRKITAHGIDIEAFRPEAQVLQ